MPLQRGSARRRIGRPPGWAATALLFTTAPALGAELSVIGPAACPDAAELLFRIERAIGKPLAEAVPLRFDVRFEAPAGSGDLYSARLAMRRRAAHRREAGGSSRDIRAHDCDRLGDAVSVAIALAIRSPETAPASTRAPASSSQTTSAAGGGAANASGSEATSDTRRPSADSPSTSDTAARLTARETAARETAARETAATRTAAGATATRGPAAPSPAAPSPAASSRPAALGSPAAPNGPAAPSPAALGSPGANDTPARGDESAATATAESPAHDRAMRDDESRDDELRDDELRDDELRDDELRDDELRDDATPSPALAAFLLADTGSLPSAGLGFGVGAELRLARFSVRAQAAMLFEQHMSLVSSAAAPGAAPPGAEMSLLFGAVAACAGVLGNFRSSLVGFACAGWELGRLGAEGIGVQAPLRGGQLWSAPRADAGVSWAPWDGELRGNLQLSALAPLKRDDFFLRDVGNVHRPPAAVGRLTLGIDVTFD